ncbi:MAG: DUF1566 domain-containing protein [Campylobacterales bacterium]|nr:DUF1566 domain-containing protein [Campylobacterales bacterium]
MLPLFITALLFADHPLPKTGQTATYATGDDGNYTSGLAPSFTTNADGTITDNTFGLMWQNSYADNGGNVPVVNHAGAITYCDALTLAGHADWRLPTRRELKSLVDYAKPYPGPVIHDAFVSTTRTDDWYWSSTTYAADTSGAWLVDFDDGTDFATYESYSYYVRCVRGH